MFFRFDAKPWMAALLLPGCIIDASDDGTRPPPPASVDYAPLVTDAEAGCYWDNAYYDDIWYFEAYVDDGNGPYDVVEAWADVYDEYAGPTLLESFELYPTDDPYVWFSDWMGSSTFLDPYYDGYTVDFVAYDSVGEAGITTVWAYTY